MVSETQGGPPMTDAEKMLKDIEKGADSYFREDERGRKHFVPRRLANDIMKDHIFKTTLDNESLFMYKDGVYINNGAQGTIKQDCHLRLGEAECKNRVAEVISIIKNATFIERSIPKNIISLSNGMFNFETMGFQKHDPDLFTITKIPLNYDPEADCPKIKKFVEQVVYKENIKTIQEIFGYPLIHDYPIQTAVLLLGGRDAGKSTTLNLLTNFLGPENVSHVPLQAFANDKFSISQLYGKLANVVPDLSKEGMKDTGMFKMVTGRDRILAQMKYQNPFYFWNTSKLIFSANQPPETKDHGLEYFKRWRLIEFPNQFGGDGEEEKKDILSELLTPEEMSGCFNWAIAGLKRLLKNGEFTSVPDIEDTRRIYLMQSSDIEKFLSEKTNDGQEFTVGKTEIYQGYVEWCKKNGVVPRTSTSFGLKLQIARSVIGCKLGPKGKQVTSWKGIGLKTEKGGVQKTL